MIRKTEVAKLFLAVFAAAILAFTGKPVFAAGEVQVGGHSYDTLSEAISNAGAGDTITLAGDLSLTSTALINQGITLNLNGHILTGPSGDKLLWITNGASVTIRNGTLTSPEDGSGTSSLIDISEACTLMLEDVKVTAHNYGAINAGYCNLYLTRCTVSGRDYGVQLSNGTLNVSGNSSISSTKNYESAGILDKGSSTLIIEGGSLSSNGNALEVGGSSTLTLSDATLTAANGKSGLDLNGSKATVTGCTISAPVAVNIATNNPTGAFTLGTTVRSSVTMTNCTISGNRGLSCDNSDLTLRNCMITSSGTNSDGINATSTMPASEKMTVTLDGTAIDAFASGVQVKNCILNLTNGTKITSGSQSSGSPAGILAFFDEGSGPCEVNITDSAVSGRKGIRAGEGVNLRINSGTVTATSAYGIDFASGVLDITGGTIEKSVFIVKPEESTLSISGGTFRNSTIWQVYTNNAFPKGFITGGLFQKGQNLNSGTWKDALGDGSIAAGYSAVPAQTGYYKVTKGNGTGSITGTDNGHAGTNDNILGGGTGTQTTTGIAVGKTKVVSGNTYKALSQTAAALTKAANRKTITIPATVVINKKTYKVTQIKANAFKKSKATKVTIGKNISKICAKAFNQSPVKTLVIKTKKLKKASAVKQCFKGSKAKKITIKYGSLGKNCVKNSFTAKNTKAKKIVLKK